jgi:hypothetical protein
VFFNCSVAVKEFILIMLTLIDLVIIDFDEN